jgi:hypothetical protein
MIATREQIVEAYRQLLSLRRVQLKFGYADKVYVHRVIKQDAPHLMRKPYKWYKWEYRRKKNAVKEVNIEESV